MKEGILEFRRDVGPLAYITPSRFSALKGCALKEVWGANKAPRLLPPAPAGRLGSAIHRLLQEAGEGRFEAEDGASVERRWQVLIGDTHRAMRRSWLERHLVPLQRSVPDYEVRHLRVLERAIEITAVASRAPERVSTKPIAKRRTYGFELPVSSSDGLVRGRIDAVLPSADGPVIRDYKSGAIFESGPGRFPALKTAHETQLRLYAALYAASHGKWPRRLEVVPVAGLAHAVTFDHETCLRLLDQARDALREVNRAVAVAADTPDSLQAQLATPSPANCAHCPYRPACNPYRRTAAAAPPGSGWPKDVWGRAEEVRQLGNSKFMIAVQMRDYRVRIRGLTPAAGRHPALTDLHQGDGVAVYNLESSGSEETLLESQFTVIYLVPAANGT
jgi:hypothetical protein